MSTALMPTSTAASDWTDEEKAVVEAAGLVFIHQYGEHKGAKVLAPRPVIAKFMHICERTGLDPLARQIYCIGRFGSDGLEWSVQTAIDGFRVIAERSKQYAGQDEAEWLTPGGEWVPAFVKALHGEHPLAARVKVYRHDWDRPMVGIATWDEYAQTKRNGELTAMWKDRGPGQLAKCAEALALRKAFPQDLSGIYTDDEMDTQVLESADGDAQDDAAPRRRRGIPTLADRARAAEQQASEIVEVAEVVEDETPAAEPEFQASQDPGFTCSNCGVERVAEDGGICTTCEADIAAEAGEQA